MSEPDAVSDLEKIRNRRLARLGANSNQATAKSPTEAQPPPPAESSRSSAGSAAAQSTSQPSQTLPIQSHSEVSNPFTQLNVAPASTNSKINVVPAKPAKPAEKTLKRSFQAADEQPLEEWQDKQLRGIFRMTLDPSETTDRRGNRLHHVANTQKELEEQGAPLKLAVGHLDAALLEVAEHLDAKSTPLDYLLPCWKRISELWRKWKPKTHDDKREVVEEARRICMSYCVFAITVPDMFDRPFTHNLFAQHLLLDQDDDRGIDHEFLLEVQSRIADDDEDVKGMVVGAVERLSEQMQSMTMNDGYKSHVLALRTLVRYPGFVGVLAESTRFLPEDVKANELEVKTLLGPFFQISPLQGPVAKLFFPSPRTQDRASIANAQEALRMSLKAHQTDLDDIVDKFIRHSKETRTKILDWFARCVNLNHKRRALQVDHREVSSDGFMLNVTSCLDTLCSPFLDASFSKLDKIDADYLRRKPRVDIEDETKINADQKASDEFYGSKADGESNFISEVFFLNVAAHHYGTEAISSSMKKLEREVKEMEKYINMLEAERDKAAAGGARPEIISAADRRLQKFRDQVDKGIAYKHATQGVLLDKPTQARSMQFMRYVIVWMLRLVSKDRTYPAQRLQLPLPDNQANVFKCLPEYFVEDVVGNFKFIVSTMPDILTSTQTEELVTLCIAFLRSSEYVRNPYLKAGLVTIMFTGTWPVYGRSKGVLTDQLNSLKVCQDHLFHSLMKFYIEVEKTGLHTQFYDKFNIRYEIFQIMKSIWANGIFRDQLEREKTVNRPFFARFVNLLLNDVTHVLDEAFSALYKIKELEQLLESPQGMALGQQAREEKEKELSESKGKAKSYMQLTNETMEMLSLFTEALPESFTIDEIVDRLATMLDYNLEAMVGPKAGHLKVHNIQEYHFDPGALLSSIVGVFLNLQNMESFVTAIAQDGRSYKHENFLAAEARLRSDALRSLRSPDEIESFMKLSERVKKAKELEDEAEQDFGDIPDEFLDPLLYTLMKDPVILPSSKTNIDRTTISSHLLSDPTDPFNRAPLTIDDVVPNTELKAQIEAFKAEKRGRRKTGTGDSMDTS